MNKADLCINHTLGTVYGWTSDESQLFHRRSESPPGKNSQVFEILVTYVDPPGNSARELEAYAAMNIDDHTTSICSFTVDSKTYVWYNNPWGWEMDFDHYLHRPDPPIFDFHDSGVADLKRRDLDAPEESQAGLFILNAGRIYPTFFPPERVREFRAWTRGLDIRHPMCVLQALKIIFDAQHLEVLHPMDTMPRKGPQSGDGVDRDIPLKCNIGACSLWTQMYLMKVDDIIGGEMDKRKRDASAILYHVKNTLNSETLHGVEPDRALIARGAQEHKYSVEALLTLVYDVIPDKDKIPDSPHMTRKRRRSHINTSWHDKVFRKLVAMVQIVEKEKEALSENKIIAGYIEGFAIVSGEDEKNKGQTYLDKTGHIATFVYQNELAELGFLKYFVEALKLLVTCKHSDDPENDEIDRLRDAEIGLGLGTRSMRRRNDHILRDTHPKLFGYNLASDRN